MEHGEDKRPIADVETLLASPDSKRGGVAAELGLDTRERDGMFARAASRLFGEGAVAGEPRQIGRYVIEGRIGVGGMGVVYRARDPELGRPIALKLLHPKYADGADLPSAERRMWREAQAMARLNHPNVVQIHEVGMHKGQLFLAMEFVDGVTLGAWIRERRPSARAIIELFCQAGEGLARAHAVGLVHRDFKPDNVLVGDGPTVKVTDFGLASALDFGEVTADGMGADGTLDGSLEPLTATGAMLGTPVYMAPEQFAGGQPDARVDQFAFCVALWEALCGQRPFAGASIGELRRNVSDGRIVEPPPGGQLLGWVRRVLERGLQPEPGRRHDDIDSLLAALRSDPTRRRWAFAGAVVVALAAGASYGAYALDVQRVEEECRADGQRIHEHWNADVREQARDGILKSGDARADEVVATALPLLDAWAERWSDERTSLCRGHRVEERVDAVTYRKAAQCLTRARLEFMTFVETITRAGAPAISIVGRIAASIEAPSACADPGELALAPEVFGPDDARDELMLRLARARTREWYGATDEGFKLVKELRELGEAKGLPDVVAATRQIEGELLAFEGRYDEAIDVTVDAFRRSGEANALKHSITAANALINMTGVLADRMDEAHAWARTAELLLARSGASETTAAATRNAYEAHVYAKEGNFERALELQHRALELREGRAPEYFIAQSYAGIASIHQRKGEIAEATAMYERALEIRTRILGERPPKTSFVVSNLGTMLFSAGKYQAARETMEQALRTQEKVLGPEHPELLTVISNLGSACLMLGDHGAAVGYMERARVLAERTLGPEHSTVGMIAFNQAGAHLANDHRDEARPLLEQALRIFEKIHGPEHPQVGMALSQLGVSLKKRDPARARALLERAHATLAKAMGPEHEYTVGAGEDLAGLLLEPGDRARARTLYGAAIAFYDARVAQHGPSERAEVAVPLHGLGRVLALEGRHAEARKVLERAVTELEGATVKNDDLLSTVRAELAGLAD